MDEIDYNYNIKPLLNTLKYYDPVVRSEAMMILAKIRDRKGINPDIRQEIANALDKIGNAADLLIKALGHEDWYVRNDAAEALSKIGDKSIVPRLMKGLSDSDWKRRQGSAWALGYLKVPQAVEPLINALVDEYPGVCYAAAEALSTITGKDFGKDYNAWLKWWNEEGKQLMRK